MAPYARDNIPAPVKPKGKKFPKEKIPKEKNFFKKSDRDRHQEQNEVRHVHKKIHFNSFVYWKNKFGVV